MGEKIFICACHSFEHQCIFWCNFELNYNPTVYLYINLINNGFFRRLKYGIKYIFGYKSRYGAFDEFIFNDEDLIKLKKYLKLKENERLKKEVEDLKTHIHQLEVVIDGI